MTLPYQHANVFDFIESAMLDNGKPMPLSDLLADAEQQGGFDTWNMDKHGLANALNLQNFGKKP